MMDGVRELRELERKYTPEAPPMLPEADLSNWEELAEAPIDSIFADGLAAGTMGLLVAPGGTGKSYLALQLALSVALGRALLPRFTPMRRGPVLCCFGEDDLAEVSRRLKAICEAHHIPPGDVTAAWREGRLSFILGKAEALLYFNHSGVATLTEAHEELSRRCAAREYRFVVVDPVVGWAGVPNENDNSAMNAAAGSLIGLAKQCGGAVLGVHHQSKQSSRGRETSTSTGRGATSMTDASRWQATLQQADAKKLGIPEIEATRFVELHVGKNSYFERDGRPLYLERINGALVDAGLSLPKSEDAIEKLARALADKIGGNPQNMAKWNLLQEHVGAEFRREFKAENGKAATKENTVKAYAVALEKGWLVEECADGDGGDNAKIPRIPAAEVVEWLY